MFHYNTGIRRRRMELLESFLVLFPIKVPWNQAYNSGVSLAPGYQWPVTSFFFWYKARFCHLLSWFIFPLLLGKLVSSLFQSSIVKRTRSNYCGLANSNGRRHWNEPVKFQNSPRQARKNAYQQVMFFLMNSDWLRKGRRSLFSQSKRVATRTVHTFNRFTFFFLIYFFLVLFFLTDWLHNWREKVHRA